MKKSAEAAADKNPKQRRKAGLLLPPEPALTLFSEEDLVSREALDRIPNNAHAFHVPVCQRSMRILLKERSGFGSELLIAAAQRLNKETQIVEALPRTWFISAVGYLGPGTKDKGGMQRDLTQIWPDFRPFYVKIKKEDGLP